MPLFFLRERNTVLMSDKTVLLLPTMIEYDVQTYFERYSSLVSNFMSEGKNTSVYVCMCGYDLHALVIAMVLCPGSQVWFFRVSAQVTFRFPVAFAASTKLKDDTIETTVADTWGQGLCQILCITPMKMLSFRPALVHRRSWIRPHCHDNGSCLIYMRND